MAAARPAFDPVDTSFTKPSSGGSPDITHDDVESPSLSSSNALARFEFEPGRSKEGTKVLMVEWEEDATSRGVHADWEISWEGKRTVLPAKDLQHAPPLPPGSTETPPLNRIYFLLGPGIAVPTAVRLQKGSAISWKTNPLPAIFSPDLGATAREEGKKGVLHTIWAKKRLQVLQGEIDKETRENSEGVGLEMAAAEKEWIQEHFGVAARPGKMSINTAMPAAAGAGGMLNSPSSPRSPGGGRLMDKLKGLKLGTSDRELNSPISGGGGGAPLGSHNPLSPETSDIAFGEGFGQFAELKGQQAPLSSLAAKAPQQRRVVAARPPESFVAQQQGPGGSGMTSMDAIFDRKEIPFSTPTPAPQNGGAAADDDEDDLFALPMSPRSPEMTKSPFSFAAQDVGRYAKGERA